MSATPDSTIANHEQIIAELRRQLAEREAELAEAIDQQTATAEVLQVINSSPGDLVPVFDSMLEKAMRLCEAGFGVLWTHDGECFHAAALRNVPAPYAEFLTRAPYRPEPEGAHGRIVNGETLVHIVDVANTELYRSGSPLRRALVDLGGARSGIAVALRKGETLLGMLVIYRQEVRPFTDKQIALLQNFAAQAVIAMENARLLTETREALERQTATAEVLGVINSSPGDLAPVFEAILEKAHRLCGAAFGSLGIFEGETWRAVVQHGYGEPLASVLRKGVRSSDSPPLQELIDGAPRVHLADLGQLDLPIARANVAAGIHALLVVALRKDDALLGTISIARCEPQTILREEYRAARKFRRAGGHRDGERAAHQRDARSLGAADRDCGSIAGHQLFARRPRASV
jgi:GAF domain-containing protein